MDYSFHFNMQLMQIISTKKEHKSYVECNGQFFHQKFMSNNYFEKQKKYS